MCHSDQVPRAPSPYKTTIGSVSSSSLLNIQQEEDLIDKELYLKSGGGGRGSALGAEVCYPWERLRVIGSGAHFIWGISLLKRELPLAMNWAVALLLGEEG